MVTQLLQLKLDWWSLNRELRDAKDADPEGFVSEAQIDDAADFHPGEHLPDAWRMQMDEAMADVLAQEEEAEFESLIASMANDASPAQEATPAKSPRLSDDGDYDALFMDLLSQDGLDTEMT